MEMASARIALCNEIQERIVHGMLWIEALKGDHANPVKRRVRAALAGDLERVRAEIAHHAAT